MPSLTFLSSGGRPGLLSVGGRFRRGWPVNQSSGRERAGLVGAMVGSWKVARFLREDGTGEVGEGRVFVESCRTGKGAADGRCRRSIGVAEAVHAGAEAQVATPIEARAGVLCERSILVGADIFGRRVW